MLSITDALPICHPANCVDAILSNSKTTSVGSTKILKTNEKRKMKLAAYILLTEILGQIVLSHSKYPCSEGLS